MFIIDFDDTIFNTRETNGFKQVRLQALQNLGISKELYNGTYMEARNLDPIGYNNFKHAKVLSKHGFNQDKVFQALEKTVEADALKTFIYPDAFSFLEKIKDFNKPVILLSFGDTEFQTLKAQRTGLDKYFDQIVIVQEHKSKAVAELIDKQDKSKVWFINNRVDETTQVKEKISGINYILKKSEDIDLKEYKQSNLPFYRTLTKIYEHIRDNR